MTKKTIFLLLIIVGIVILSTIILFNEAESAETYKSLQLFEIQYFTLSLEECEMIALTEKDLEKYPAFRYLLEDVGYKRTMPITDHPLGDLFYIHKCIDTQTVNEMMNLYGSKPSDEYIPTYYAVDRVLYYNDSYYRLTILDSSLL